MSDWQPIETAPKDGRWVLVYGGLPDTYHDDDRQTNRPSTPPMVSAKWDESCVWTYTSYDGGFYGEWENPTHWMPIPEPPNR